MTTTVECPRCGGAGGWVGWPEFTCYLCRGTGTRQRSRAPRLTPRQKERAAYLAEAHTCAHCGETKVSDRWCWMKGTELWCGDCFRGFGK